MLAWGAGDSRDGMSALASNGTPPPGRARKRLCPPASARELRDLLPAGARAFRCSPARTRRAGAARASLEIARETHPDFRRRGYGEVKTTTLSTCRCPPTLGQVKRLRGSLGKEIGEVPSLGKF